MSSFDNTLVTRSDHSDNLYNYTPTRWVCIVFVVLFSISHTIHIGQAVGHRMLWLFITAVPCCTAEIIGWSGRLWSSYNPVLRTPFLIQVSTLIMAPTYLVATNFVILGRIIKLLGPKYCRMSQKYYTIVFITCDTTALVIQLVGGGIASGTKPGLGGHIALGGIVLQFAALLFFAFIAGEFLLRFIYDHPIRTFQGATNYRGVMDRNLALMTVGVSTMTSLLVRSTYRTIELSGGWSGPIISTQWLFNTFDGAMIVLATFTLNILHPGILLREYDERLERIEVGTVGKHNITSSPSVQSA